MNGVIYSRKSVTLKVTLLVNSVSLSSMMCARLIMTSRPTLLVLIGLTLLHGTSSTFYIAEPSNCPAQKQVRRNKLALVVLIILITDIGCRRSKKIFSKRFYV